MDRIQIKIFRNIDHNLQNHKNSLQATIPDHRRIYRSDILAHGIQDLEIILLILSKK